MKEVKNSGIIPMEISSSMVAEVVIELIESSGVIVVSSSVHEVETLAGMGMEKSQPILGLLWDRGLCRVSSGKRKDKRYHHARKNREDFQIIAPNPSPRSRLHEQMFE